MKIQEMRVKAHAKINLFLKICGKRNDGYHLLSTLMQSISLGDDLYVKCSEPAQDNNLDVGVLIRSSTKTLPRGEKNTAYRAARMFMEELQLSDVSIEIEIGKHIPSQAGLGGGSADAAAVLHLLNLFYKNAISKTKLISIASKVGADVPFCLLGHTHLCEGIGEVMTPASSLSGLPLLLIRPNCNISTTWAFSQMDSMNALAKPLQGEEEALHNLMFSDYPDSTVERIKLAAPFLVNQFETIGESRFPVLAKTREFLLEKGAILARLSGSGSTVFGVFQDTAQRDQAFCESIHLRDRGFFVEKAETCDGGY